MNMFQYLVPVGPLDVAAYGLNNTRVAPNAAQNRITRYMETFSVISRSTQRDLTPLKIGRKEEPYYPITKWLAIPRSVIGLTSYLFKAKEASRLRLIEPTRFVTI